MRTGHHTWLVLFASLLLASYAGAVGMDSRAAVDADGDPPVIPGDVVDAIRRGQRYLQRTQQTTGAWSGGTGPTALAVMALMVDGSMPGSGAYGAEVAKGVQYLVGAAKSSGLIHTDGGHTMYHHALATLCLSEAWGMTAQPEIGEVLRKAVDLIVRSQHASGGWRYDPRPSDHDLSVTVMQIVALRGADNAGIAVPAETIQQAISYVRSTWHEEKGGFAYQPDNSPSLNMTAAGVLSLQLCGLYDDPLVRKGVAKLEEKVDTIGDWTRYFFYGNYYAMQAMYQFRDTDKWRNWYTSACMALMDKQKQDGAITKEEKASQRVYQTAFACLAMGLPYRYLPIFQR